jgi:hypothetical protein
LVFGSILILFGVIGGFIPILQGWIFVVAGLTLMAPESQLATRVLDRAKAKLRSQRRAQSVQIDSVETVESGTPELSSKEDENSVG